MGEQRNLQVEDILQDKALSLDILDIAGHYAFHDADVIEELNVLYENLAKHHIDGQRFVVDHIKRPLQQYAECYHLKGVTTRIRKTMKESYDTEVRKEGLASVLTNNRQKSPISTTISRWRDTLYTLRA